jgi:hypothetical protein
MARLKQFNPGNYRSSDRISQDIENIVRYVNSAEIGDKTIGELLKQIFNDSGEFDGPVEFRYDAAAGFQYRIGEYVEQEEGWITIADPEVLKGNPGTNIGTIFSPVFFGRVDYTATGGQTNFTITLDADEDVLVWVNGLLKREGALYDYVKDEANDRVTFNSGLLLNDKVSISKVRTDAVNGYVRQDTVATGGQVVFAFVHSEDDELLVYRNGILQREGGGYDYTASPATDTITFTSGLTNGDLVTIITVENRAQTTVAGLLTEDEYTDSSGFILGSKVAFANDAIPQSKINGLAATLTNRGKIYVQGTEPVSPNSGDFWLDTSLAPNVLKVWGGSDWVLTSPNINIPEFDGTKAQRVLRVNSSGTGLEWVLVDLSSRISTSTIDAPNGVCPLDSDGLVPVSNLPDIFAQESIYREITGLAATSYTMRVAYSQTVRIDSIVLKTNTGTCNVEIEVDGVVVSAAPVSANSTLTATNLPVSITVNAESSPRRIGVKTSSLAGTPASLEVTLATSEVTV